MRFRLIEMMISAALMNQRRVGIAAAIDAFCAAAITFISAVPYLSHLGFYSDDWGLLARFSVSGTQSFAALVHDIFPGRPIQGVYLTLLFRAFGLNPFGYHLVNTAVLAASAALLSSLLLRLGIGRAPSFATTIVFVLLPQLSTVRVWYAAFQVPLSLALMLISMHCQLSFCCSGKIRWAAGAILAAVLSVGAYEIFAPLIAGFALSLVFLRWRRSNRMDNGPIAAAAVVLVLMILAFVYKVAFSGRAGPIADPQRYLLGVHQLFRLDYDWRVDSGLNIVATPRTHFWAPVHGWSAGAGALLRGGAGLEVSAIALFIAGVVVWRLSVRTGGTRAEFSLRLLILGIAAFLLGNATFLVVPAVVFTSTGMDNRVQVAAALGVAMIFVALISYVTDAIPLGRRGIVFCAVIAVVSASAFARLSAIERYWANAPVLQRVVLNAARTDLQNLPANSTVILDGVCPYYGPAVVYETSWDVGGALTLALGRPLAGDAVSPRMSMTAQGLQTSMYKIPSFYPYGRALFIYNPSTHVVVSLRNANSAVRYFANRQPTNCPGLIARGAAV
jgi:hypothetical protein